MRRGCCGFRCEGLSVTLILATDSFVNPSFTLAAALGVVSVGFATGWILNGSPASRPDGVVTLVDGSVKEAVAGQLQPGSPPPRVGAVVSPGFASRLDELAHMRAPFRRARAIDEIADGLDFTEIRDALSTIETQGLRDRDEIRLQLLSRWAELEPEAALEYARKLPSGFIAPDAIKAVVESWFANDAGAAEQGVEKMPESFAKQIAWGVLVASVAETDPKRALTMLHGTTLSVSAVDAMFEKWAEIDPEEAATHAARFPPGFTRDFAMRRASENFAEADRERALAWAQSLSGSQITGATIERREPGPLAAILGTWMKEDAQAARQWLEALPDDFAKVDVLALLSGELADEEPDKAVEVAVMMPAGAAQDSALRKLVGSWARKDFAGALAWAQEQGAEVRQVLLPPLVQQLAWRDRPAALELALSVDGQARQRAVRTVLEAWTRTEPEAAASWAATQPDNAKYLESIAFDWAGENEQNSRAWVEKLPVGETKDAVVLSGIRRIAQSDQPQVAERWIAEISDPEKRVDAYWTVGWWWLQSNPKKAQEWIRAAPIPEKTKSELLTPTAK